MGSELIAFRHYDKSGRGRLIRITAADITMISYKGQGQVVAHHGFYMMGNLFLGLPGGFGGLPDRELCPSLKH